ncbi:class I SAM-dependent methyltransferase [Sulfitobacter sp. S190]|uniref:class I SAM-dependent methyltransferase n=1 Tax=Sulfitobacter sp. S190 TaxID=2867022 RepID=UPI0021A5AE7A|nr:class I SAM-dependent methyltransferase [Sulfitobacter sp. S190]UWR21016.1 class I SAM-dependent methyltransferase [Sulfitobacter sp. S190]
MVSLNRVVMGPASRKMIQRLEPKKLRVAEISGHYGEQFDFRAYTQFRYPEYDICAGPYLDPETGKPRKFDLILANQVWEHLDRPYTALRHVRQMLKKGGHFWIAVPFYVPFHAAPMDNSRWSARGLKNLLIEGGFEAHLIESHQWGNRHVAARNLEVQWPPEYIEGKDDITDDPMMPVCAWAIAQKS